MSAKINIKIKLIDGFIGHCKKKIRGYEKNGLACDDEREDLQCLEEIRKDLEDEKYAGIPARFKSKQMNLFT